jgi:hypothetical protein
MEEVDWVDLVEDDDKVQKLLNMVLVLSVPQNGVDILTVFGITSSP